jgi:3-oxoacyl-(acyl-carrier-protein) synthase/SAM-dependent methyltransferase
MNSKPESLSAMQQAILDIRALRGRLEASERRQHEPIAIVGAACRFPGEIDSLDSFWNALSTGTDAIGEIPADRWDACAYYDPDPDAPGRMSVRCGGFLKDVDRFDPEFFGISEREAVSIDPQHRLLLEVGWEALENAGIPAGKLFGSPAGVFIGISSFDYGQLRGETGDRSQMDAYHATGVSHSAASGRLAYFLGLKGPAISIDTACSSSLVAIHLACQSLRSGECRVALAGGVNLILSPEIHITLSKARMMAPDGRCKAFDESADGFIRSEGCGIVVLKPLGDAIAAGDRIHAVIRGSACNQDGRSSGLTAPNGPSQTAVIQAAWRAAGIDGSQLGYVEAHGTGTALGDPIEAGALTAALGEGEGRLSIGSLKSNLGHMEAAAGVGGLIKTMLALRYAEIPGSLHFKRPSSHIEWDRLEVVDTARAWPRSTAPRMAGVSSFGFSGTNVHIVLEEAPSAAPGAGVEDGRQLLTLSAHHEPALREVAHRLACALRAPGASLADVAFTANAGRNHFPQRAALIAESTAEAAAKLEEFAETGASAGVAAGRVDPQDAPEPASTQEPLERLASLYVRGAAIDWDAIYQGRRGRLVELSRYPWNRQRYWFSTAPSPDAEERWQAAVESGSRQADQTPINLLLHTYADKYRALDELATAYILQAFRALGAFAIGGGKLRASDLCKSYGVLPLYENLMENWLRKLAKEGVLTESGGEYFTIGQLPCPDPAPMEEAASALFADSPMLLDYVKGCGGMLAPILTGKATPLDTLFPGGSFELAEAIYHRAPLSRYFNAIAGAVAGGFAQGRPGPLRVLEVGAGTGGTTASILPMLPAARTEYTFTDVSEFFFARAARRFERFPFLNFGLLDLERAPESQGYGTGQYDIVVAANVLHATRRLGQTLDYVRSLLAPDGVLLLYEVTDPPSYFDVSIALIEGWQASEDAGRRSTPLLGTEEWQELLAAHGFQATACWPEAGSPAGVLGSHVFAARAGGCAAPGAVMPARSPAAARAEVERSTEEGEDPLAALDEAPAGEHLEMLAAFVRRQVGLILRSSDELRNKLERGVRQPLPATLIFNYPSIADIAGLLLTLVRGSGKLIAPEPNIAPQHRMTVEELNELTDPEVERLLDMKLQRLEAE